MTVGDILVVRVYAYFHDLNAQGSENRELVAKRIEVRSNYGEIDSRTNCRSEATLIPGWMNCEVIKHMYKSERHFGIDITV